MKPISFPRGHPQAVGVSGDRPGEAFERVFPGFDPWFNADAPQGGRC
jgi:hypothetical protein